MKRIGVAGLMFVVLLFTAQAVSAEGWPGCPWGRTYDAMANGYVGDCFAEPATDTQAAAKPAGLAQPALVEKFVPCGFGERLDPLALACQRPASVVDAAVKPAGLAQLAPVEKFVPCGFGERLDPLALACQQPAASAAAKPAGLAAPAQARFVPCLAGFPCSYVSKPAGLAAQAQGSPCGVGSEAVYAAGYVTCVDVNRDASAAPKPVGLAKLAPALTEPWNGLPDRSETATLVAPAPAVDPEQGWPGCPWCYRRPVANAAASKPVGLAKLAPALTDEQNLTLDWVDRQIRNGNLATSVGASNQDGQDCPWGYPSYDGVTHTFVSQCANTKAVAVAKPAGLAAPVPGQEQFVPCGFGERLDPLALACQQ